MVEDPQAAPFDIERFEAWLRSNPGFSQAVLKSIKPLSADGSGRIFWRIWLAGVQVENYVYIEHPLTGGPVFEGDAITQAQAFIEAGRGLAEYKIPVPKILAADPVEGRVVMEDIGDIGLGAILYDAPGELREQLEESLTSEWIDRLFEQALDITVNLQAIPFDKRFVGFRRYRSIDLLRAETSEFIDHYAEGKGLRVAARDSLKKTFDGICEELSSFPKTLSLFDFNCFNLFIDQAKLDTIERHGKQASVLRIVDFQDVSLNSPARDVFSLVNDRGIDELLGKERQRRLLAYFIEKKSMNEVQRAEFIRQYYITALQWDFKNIGRFHKLNALWQTDRYAKWVPPTLRRLGRMLLINQKLLPGLGDALDIVRSLSPEAKEGSEEDWSFQ